MPRNKKSKPVSVEYNWPIYGWKVSGRYKTLARAEQAVKAQNKKHGGNDYRVNPLMYKEQ